MKKSDEGEVANELQVCPTMVPAAAMIRYTLSDLLVSLMIGVA